MTEDDCPRAHGVYHHYRSYLLRLWQETPGARWRASLQDAASGELTAFGSTEQLVAFLQDLNARDDASTGPTGGM